MLNPNIYEENGEFKQEYKHAADLIGTHIDAIFNLLGDKYDNHTIMGMIVNAADAEHCMRDMQEGCNARRKGRGKRA